MAGELKAFIIECFHGITNPSNEVRQKAEAALNSLEQQTGFGVVLAQIALEKSFPTSARQLASIALKKYVKEHWSDGAEESVPPQTCEEDKHIIKQLLPAGLSDPETKIRTSVAMAIASIAHWDWPTYWPRLIEDLVTCLHSTDANLMKGAIKCLDIFADGSDLSDQYLPSLISLLFPELYKIFSNPSYGDRIRMRCVSIVYSLIRWLAIIKAEYQKDISQFFANVMPQWIKDFAALLGTNSSDTQTDCGIKISIMKVLIIIIGDFPKHVAKFLPILMTPVWNSLVQGVAFYEKTCVFESHLTHSFQDSDGEVLGFETLIALLLEFVHCVVERKNFRSMLSNHLTDVIYFVIPFIQMTIDQEEQWSSDPNQYVADEEDVANNYSVRISACNLIAQLVQDLGTPAVKSLCTASAKRLNEAENYKKKNDIVHWWKLKEAVYSALGGASEDITACEDKSAFDTLSFLNNVLRLDIDQSVIPFLRGRALWCASQFSSTEIPQECVLPFLNSATISLQSTNEALPVKIGACRCIGTLMTKLSQQQQLLIPFLPAILAGATLLLQHATEETLHLILDTLSVAVKINGDITAQYEQHITPIILASWETNIKDHLITDIIQEILHSLLNNPNCFNAVQQRILPAIVTVLNSPQEIPALSEASINLLTSLVNASPANNPLPLDHSFNTLCDLMMRTEESAIMQEATHTFAAFIKKYNDTLVKWKPAGSTFTGFERILQVIAKMLSPTINDNCSLYVGEMINTLIRRMSTHLATHLAEMLKSIVNRLQAAKMPSFIQSLILVFAKLIHTHAAEVVNFLSSIQVSTVDLGSISALTYVLTLWTKNHLDFQGSYNVKLSMTALVELFKLNDARISSVVVPGDLIIEQPDKIVTRSKSKQTNTKEKYTMVPFQVKVVQLLLKEYQVIQEEEDMADEEEEEDDEWEDAEDENDAIEDEEDIAKALGIKSSTFVDASVFFDENDCNSNEDEPDVKDDPVNNINLKQYVEDWINNFAKSDGQSLGHIAQNYLIAIDKECLQNIVTGNSAKQKPK